ncbi:MAG: DUF998 domain-containing protein [Candidatus Bathyarchaeia archaeon]
MRPPARPMLLKLAGACGLTAAVLVPALILLAVQLSPWFSWTENALSDLGVRGVAATIFNSALMIGGWLVVIFAFGLGETLRGSKLGRVGAFFLLLDGLSLFAVGLFPESAGLLHFYVSVAFFTLLPVSLLLIGAAPIAKRAEGRLGLYAVGVALFAVIVWLLPWRGKAIPEALASFPAAVWLSLAGIRILKQKPSLA